MIGYDDEHFSTHFIPDGDPNISQMVVATDEFVKGVKLLLFVTPIHVNILQIDEEKNDENLMKKVDLDHPEEDFGTQPVGGKIISRNNLVFHFYSKKHLEIPIQGICVDRLDLKRRNWIKLEDLSSETNFVDTFVANDDIYLIYTKHEDNSIQFICKCDVTDDLNIQLVRSSERKLNDNAGNHTNEKLQRFIVPRSAMPLDFV